MPAPRMFQEPCQRAVEPWRHITRSWVPSVSLRLPTQMRKGAHATELKIVKGWHRKDGPLHDRNLAEPFPAGRVLCNAVEQHARVIHIVRAHRTDEKQHFSEVSVP
jgi:hypothetical protein